MLIALARSRRDETANIERGVPSQCFEPGEFGGDFGVGVFLVEVDAECVDPLGGLDTKDDYW